MNEMKVEKARNLRYKKAAMERINFDSIQRELEEISENCDNVRYFFADDDDTLLNALDGDEDEAHEFTMMFCDLSSRCEELYRILSENDCYENFDDFMVAIIGNRYKSMGYDSYEEDYCSLTDYESGLAQTEAGKRIMRLTKQEMISTAGQCIGITVAFLDLCQQYDYLKATFDILLNENNSYLCIVKDIEQAYSAAADDEFREYGNKMREYTRLIEALPDRAWLE